METTPGPDSFGRRLKELDRNWAPAFFLLAAVALYGLRSALAWEVFAAAFFCRAWLAGEVFLALPGGLWPWFFGWLGISAVFSPEPLNSLSQLSKYLVCAAFLSLTAKSNAAARKNWSLALFGAALACAAVIFYQRFSGAEVYGLIGRNPNYSAALVAGAFAAAWVFMFSEQERRSRALYGLLSAFFAAAIIAANSRGALLAAALAAGAWLAAGNRRRALFYLAAALAAAAAAASPELLSFLFKLADPRAYARVWLWKSALLSALERPFFGFGPGLFERAFELFKFPYFNGFSYYGHSTLHAHSEILNLAAEAGLPAAALFTAALVFSIKEKSRCAYESAMKLCAVALFIQAAFDVVFYSGAVSLLFFGSLGFAHGRAPRAEGGRAAARLILPALGLICVLGLAPRIVFERDQALALKTAPPRNGRALRRALVFAPRDKELLLEAARARLAGSGNYALAAAYAENAAVFCPKDPRFSLLAAEAFMRGGAAGPAYAELEKALALEPGFLGARYALARLLYSGGKFHEAAAQAELIEKLNAACARGAPPETAYDAILRGLDREAFDKLKKELWKKKTTGNGIAYGLKTR